MVIWIKRLGLLLLAAAIGAGFYLALRAQPVPVDLAEVARGPMRVTIDEEGVARVRDIYTVSSPIPGHLDRTKLEEGEAVVANETIIASIHPLDPPFLDERTQAEFEAAAEAARSAIFLAEVERARAQLAYEQAKTEYDRAAKLAKTNVISDSMLERAYNEMKLLAAQVDSSEAVIRLREAELHSAEARLRQPGDEPSTPSGPGCCFNLVSPVDGVVLKVLARSEQAVAQGTPITEVGDPRNIEIVVDLQSSDAPKLTIGASVEISEWGGPEALRATIRRIDPAAFTKVSSLGIEEQRVNAILDLESVPEDLGHGYRVLAKLEVWAGEDVLQVPIGAMFRADGDWAVFAVEGDTAVLRRLSIGHLNNRTAEVLDGLAEGDKVILYPNDLLEDGSPVTQR